MRQNLDLLLAHSRELVRHLIAGVLLLGTCAGTMWTFSNGGLTLSGAWERLVSVGGIALALEAGAIFTGLYIQAIDARIRSAKRQEQRAEYKRFRKQLYAWFAAVLAISFYANLEFRTQQLHDARLAAFVSIAPIVLICLFTIVLRPIPVDYAELGREATQRGLLVLTRNAQSVMLRYMRTVGRGNVPTPEQQQGMQFAAAVLRSYAQAQEQQALDYALAQGTGATNVIETTAIEYLSSADVESQYRIPRRTAQLWVSQAQGRKRATKGNSWLAPASAIYSTHGLPKPSDLALSASERHIEGPMQGRMSAQRPASGAQDDATGAQVSAELAQVAVLEAQ